MTTKIERKIRELLRAGSIHVDGTDVRTINEAIWQENVKNMYAYVSTLPASNQRRLAFMTALEVREDLVVYPAHEAAPLRHNVIATSRARKLQRFIEAIR